MLRLSLLAAIVTFSVQAVEVRIRYAPPVLGFTLPLSNRDIRGVVFNYAIGDKTYQARGVKTSEGWQFQTRDVSLNGVDTVFANAVLYDGNGNMRMTTSRSSLTLGRGSSVPQLPSRRIRGAVIWRDDFSSLILDTNRWKYEVSMYGGYNGEFQVYTNDAQNVYLKNGLLYLKPTLTINDVRFDEHSLHHGKMDVNALFGYCTKSVLKGCYREAEKDGLLPPIMSGKISSTASLKYGTVEVRAKIPIGDWLWPAIWMLPRDSKYGWSPKSGEIDIMETTGNKGYWGIQRVFSTLHWGPDADRNQFRTTQGFKVSESNWHDAFHIWTVDWTPDHIATYIDNEKIFEVSPPSGGFWEKGGFSGTNIWQSGNKMAPFDQEFYLILNVAVGGTGGMFSDGPHKPWKNSSPNASEEFWNSRDQWLPTWQGDNVAMEVDYVEFRNF